MTIAIKSKKVMLKNICKMLVSMDLSPMTEEMDAWFTYLLGNLRAFLLDLVSTTFH